VTLLTSLVVTTSYGFLAYFGLTSRQTGFKGTVYKIGGGLSAGFSCLSIYLSISDVFKHSKRKKEILVLEDKLQSFDY
jgi:hypothetical protein